MPVTRPRRPHRALFVAVIGFAACSPPRAALVGDLPEPVVVSQGAEHFELSAANTRVEAEVSAGPTFTIGFDELSGTLDILVSDPKQSLAQVNVDMTHASSTPAVVAEVAMSADFLDAAAFPTAAFRSRALEATSDGDYEMIGELTLHGVTRGLRMPIELTISDCFIDAVIAFSFDRHDFGIQNEGSLESLVADTVAVRFVLHLERANRSGC